MCKMEKKKKKKKRMCWGKGNKEIVRVTNQ